MADPIWDEPTPDLDQLKAVAQETEKRAKEEAGGYAALEREERTGEITPAPFGPTPGIVTAVAATETAPSMPSYNFPREMSLRADPIGVPRPTGFAREEQTNPDFYRRSETPPMGWTPSPMEISRLVETGLLSPKEAKNTERVWKAGRADVARRGGNSWMERNIMDVMLTDAARGASAVRDAVLTQAPYTMIKSFGGDTPVLDTGKMFNEVENIWYSKVLKEMKTTPGRAAPQQLQEARKEAERRAGRTMSEIMQSGGRRLWADPLDRDLTEEIMQSNVVWRMFRALASPVQYGVIGYNTKPGKDRAPLVMSPQQLKHESWLVTLGRFAPSTLVTAALATDSWPWERPAIEAVRAGEDIVYHTGDISKFLSQQESSETVPTWAKIAGAGAVLGIIFTEPDLISLMTLGGAKLAKPLKLAKTNARLAKGAKVAEEVASDVERGAIDLVEAHKRLMGHDEALGRAIELNAGAKLQVGGIIHKEMQSLFDEVATLRTKAEGLRKEALEAQKEVRTAQIEQDALRAEHAAKEMDVAADALTALISEAEKNFFLMMHGLTWEAAAKVTSRKKIPVDQQALKGMRGSVAKLEKELGVPAGFTRPDGTVVKKPTGLHKEFRPQQMLWMEETGKFAQFLDKLVEGFPPEALRKGKPRKTWDWSPKGKEGASIPMIGQQVQFPTQAGGFRTGRVLDVDVVGYQKADGAFTRFPSKAPKKPRNDYRIAMKIETPATARNPAKIHTIYHPLKIDYKTGANLQTRRRTFLRADGIYRKADGPHDQIAALTMAIADGKAAIKMMEEGSGVGTAVSRYGDSMTALKASNAAYKASAKALKATEKPLEGLIKQWTGKSTKEARTKIQSIEQAKIPEIFSAAAREVGTGLSNFRLAGLQRMGIEGFSTPRMAAKSAWKAGKLTGEDLTSFGNQLSDAATYALGKEIRSETVRLDPTGASVDVPKLVEALGGRIGDDFATELPKYEVLAALVKKAAQSGDAPVRITRKGAGILREEIDTLVRYGEAKDLFTKEAEWGRAIFDAWRDIGLSDPMRARGEMDFAKSLREGARKKLRTLGQMGANVAVRVGEVSKEVEAAMVTSERYLSRGRLELLEISRNKKLINPVTGRAFDDAEERMIFYMDTTNPIPMKEGTSRWAIATGNGSAFQKGKSQILADSRVNERLVEGAKKKAEAARDNLFKLLESKLGTVVKGNKEGVTPEELRTLLTEQVGEGLDEFLALTQGRQLGQGLPLSLTAITHAWIPPYAAKRISDQESLLLYALGRGALNKAKTYEDFTKRMRRVTYAVLGDVEGTHARAHASSSAGFMLGGSLGELGYQIERAIGGSLKAEQAADVNRVLMGDFKDIKDMGGALNALGKYGMPFTQEKIVTARVQSAVTKMGEKSRELVALGTKDGGTSFVPKAIIDSIEEQAGRIAKELEATHITPRLGVPGASAMNAYLSAWRGSAVTGLIVPNPRYWTNNMMGDFSQMWVGEGAAFAARRSFINFPTNIPFFGRAMQVKGLWMAEKMAGKSGTKPVLPGIIETMFNPHLGRVFTGDAGTFVTKNGDVWTYDQLRRASIDDGISEAFVREELMQVYGRIEDRFKHKVGQGWDDWHRMFNEHAALVQERQRVGMYADLIQRGVPRAEAAKRTKSALYDWSHGIAEWEARTVSRIVPFWRFWRLALKQVGDALIEPFVRPSGEMFKKAMTGDTKLAHIRQQLLIWPSLPDFIYQDDVNAGLGLNQRVDLLAKQLYPDYEETRAHITVRPMDGARARNYELFTGRRYTHESLILPTITATDTMDMLIALATGVGIVAGKVVEAVPGQWAEKATGLNNLTLAGDYEAKFYEPILGSTQPLIETGMRALLSTMGADLDYEVRGDWRNLNPAEEEIFSSIPTLRAMMQKDTETGRYRIPQSIYLTYRALPIASTQAAAWIGGVGNIAWKEGTVAGTMMMLRKLTRFGDVKPFNVYDQVRGRAYDIQDEYNEFIRDNKDVRSADLSLRGRFQRQKAAEEDE